MSVGLYLLLLSLIAWMVFADVAKKKRKDRETLAAGKEVDKLSTGIEWHKTMHKIKIPPMIHFKTAQIYCSAWLPIFVSFLTGWLAGILGIGGGLIRMPALIYFVGCPTHVAVGTDLFEVMISGLYGTATYTYKGRTELVAAMIMLCGAAVGAQVGTVATKYIKGYGIRIAFGLAVIGCAISIFLKINGQMDASLWRPLRRHGHGPHPGAGGRHVALYLCAHAGRGQARDRRQEGPGLGGRVRSLWIFGIFWKGDALWAKNFACWPCLPSCRWPWL